MPNGSLNAYLSIQSGNSEQTLVSLTDKTRALDKETQLLTQATDALAKANAPLLKSQTELQAQLKVSQKEVNALQKAYDEYGDEMMKLDLDQAIENHAKLKEELTEVNAQLGANQRTYKDYLEIVRKGGLSTSGGSLGTGEADSGLSSLGTIVAGLGVWNQVSSLVQAGADDFLESMLGSGAGSIASGALSSAMSGATLGTTIAPGIGTAIGAALGGIVGAAGGAIEQWGSQDEAFKDYYGGLYDDVKGRSGEMVEAGTTLASGRETNRISFKTLFGDEKVAQRYLENLIDMANYTPFLYDDLVSMSKTLATYGYSPDAGSEYYILDALQTIGDTGAALGMGTSDMSTVAQALGRMKSSDKATLEYLNMLNDRGIGAVGMLAEAKGVSQGDMYSIISKSEISGTEAVEIIMAALKETYTGSMEEQSRTFDGLSSTLEGLQQNLDALGGEGYNTLRGEGIKEEINALGGSLGEAIGEINAIMGENQARRENLEAQYMREALEAVLLGKQGSVFSEEENAKLAELSAQYAELKERYDSGDTEAGLELEALYETAQALGQSYYDNSEYVQTLTDVEMDEIQAILDNTAGLNNLNTVIYDLPQRLSVGRAGTTENKEKIAEATGTLFPGLAAGGLFLGGSTDAALDMLTGSSHAFGLDRVPYDDYPALLHQGERVLTASEARAQDAGQMAAPIQIPITGNTFLGMPEEVADQIAEIIARKLAQAAIAAAPK